MTKIEMEKNEACRETTDDIKRDDKLTRKQKRIAQRAVLKYHINLGYTLNIPPQTLINMTDNEEIPSYD